MLIANFYGSLAPDTRATIYSVLRTMRAAFPQVYVIATAGPASEELQNFIFVGHNASNLERRADLGRAAALEWRASGALLESYPVLTDDFAPVEYYAANAIRRYDAISRKAH